MRVPDRPIALWWAARFGREPSAFLGSRDVGELLGVTRERVGQLDRTAPTFPRPFNTQFGRVWWRAGIEAWVAVHRPDRARSGNPFGTESIALLTNADRHADRLGHGYVGVEHLWLALLAGERAGRPRMVLESMGLDVPVVEAIVLRASPGLEAPRTRRMTPHAQQVLQDVAAGPVDSRALLEVLLVRRDPSDAAFGSGGIVEGGIAARGFDPQEALSRLRTGDLGERRELLGPPPPAPRPEVLRVLRACPDGEDPWDRHPWGSVGVALRDDTAWEIGGHPVCVFFDRDGHTVRVPDGRPVGYVLRGSVPLGEFEPIEVLPMPPGTARDWTEWDPRD